MNLQDIPLTVSSIAGYLTSGHRIDAKPAVPMPGGFGVQFAHVHPELCNRYVYAYSAAQRARLILELLGDRINEETAVKSGGRSSWFRRTCDSASEWWRLHHRGVMAFCLQDANEERAERLKAEASLIAKEPDQDWKPVLGALALVGSTGNDKSLKNHLQYVMTMNVESKHKRGAAMVGKPFALDPDLRIDRDAWARAAECLVDPTRAAEHRAAYFCFRLHSLLCLDMPEARLRQLLYTFVQLRILEAALGREEPVDGSTPCQQDRTDIADWVMCTKDALLSLRIFGGEEPSLGLAPQLPVCFQRFAFQSAELPEVAHVALRAALQAVAMDPLAREEVTTLMKAADHLAVMVADSLFDPMRLDQIEYDHAGDSLTKTLYSAYRGAARKLSEGSAGYAKRRLENQVYFDDKQTRYRQGPREGEWREGKVTDHLRRLREIKRLINVPAVTSNPTRPEPVGGPAFHWACCKGAAIKAEAGRD